MIGAGVRRVRPAAEAAGSGLLIGLVLAAVVAYCNATSSAQLAAAYPTSGGTYVYGRERLGDVVGLRRRMGLRRRQDRAAARRWRSPSRPTPCPPGGSARSRPSPRSSALAAVNYRGVTRTAGLTRVLVAVVLAVLRRGRRGRPRRRGARTAGLGAVRAATAAAGTASCSRPGCCSSPSPATPASPPWARRSATRARTIPRAIPLALVIAVVVYAVVAVALLRVARPGRARRPPTRRWPTPSRRRRLGLGRTRSCASAPRRRARRAARADRRRRAHHASRWPASATCPRWLAAVAPALPGAAPRRARARRGRGARPGAHRRPARGDRLLVVRRAASTTSSPTSPAFTQPRPPPLPAGAPGARRRGLRHPRWSPSRSPRS